ncbi:DedA family protein [Micromonospora sp. NPDC050397]|uniref:DedA family protein n=1 Tax=Micromonospora sp. NPDC050397 TaxID=3364279 RepID=UPI0038517330
MTVAAGDDPTEAGGLTGWVASVIDAIGPLGVGLLVALENLVPPIPSEVVLLLAGSLSAEGRGNVLVMWLAATAGSVLGALALYWVGAALGEDRLKRWLDRIPLVDADDLERADRWFARYGTWAVLFGRMVPVVRSLVSVPAGANHMPITRFLVLTTVGSGLWNAVFVGLGFALGSHWQRIDRYSTWFDLALLAGLLLVISTWVVKRLRRRTRPRARPGTSG